MPVYDYLCPHCGSFEQLRPLAQSAQDADCPDCGSAAPRMVSAPRLSILSPHKRQAHETNERSRHEPRVSKKPSCCAQGTCSSHGGGSAPSKGAASDAGPALKQQAGVRRPWMISH